MSDEPDDVTDITSICSSLNINIGTLHKSSIEAMYPQKEQQLGHLYPFRSGRCWCLHGQILPLVLWNNLQLTVIRGNISEIKTLANGNGTTKGVDADVADKVTDDT